MKIRRGRPWVYSKATVRAIAQAIENGASKKQACADVGVAYSSFMRWQRQKRAVQRLIEDAERTYSQRRRARRELEILVWGKSPEFKHARDGHNRRPYRDPDAQPVKWMKLIQWWLVHRVPLDKMITAAVEAAACARFKIPEWKWEEAKQRFPKLLLKVNQKRLRRIEYALERGKFPPKGWTPPDPKNRATQNASPYARFWKH